jgi:hypothetical protein
MTKNNVRVFSLHCFENLTENFFLFIYLTSYSSYNRDKYLIKANKSKLINKIYSFSYVPIVCCYNVHRLSNQ